MKALLQRVSEAGVSLEGETIAEIGPGLVVLVCTEKDDGEADADYFARKVANMRLFADADGIPDMERMATDGTRLFIQLRRLAPLSEAVQLTRTASKSRRTPTSDSGSASAASST